MGVYFEKYEETSQLRRRTQILVKVTPPPEPLGSDFYQKGVIRRSALFSPARSRLGAGGDDDFCLDRYPILGKPKIGVVF